MIHDLFFEVAADDNIGTCILIISNHADTAWAEAKHLSLHFLLSNLSLFGSSLSPYVLGKLYPFISIKIYVFIFIMCKYISTHMYFIFIYLRRYTYVGRPLYCYYFEWMAYLGHWVDDKQQTTENSNFQVRQDRTKTRNAILNQGTL